MDGFFLLHSLCVQDKETKVHKNEGSKRVRHIKWLLSYLTVLSHVQLYDVFQQYAESHPSYGLTIQEFKTFLKQECAVSNKSASNV